MAVAELVRPIEILLIEDNPGDVRLTIEALKEGKVVNRLSVAKDGIEALAMLRKEEAYHAAPRPDLILLDLNLPKKDGREVLAEIKNDPKLKRIPVVVLTTSQDEHDVLRSYNLHANCYITKPVDLEQFIKVVKSIEDFWASPRSRGLIGAGRSEAKISGNTMRLLLVEDNDGDAVLLREHLEETSPGEFEVRRVERLNAALALLSHGHADVALLDLSLPDSQGVETLRRLHASAQWLPIVVLTSLDDESLGLELVQAGAQDYLIKGQVTGPLLVRSLRYAVERKRTAEALRLSEERYALAFRGSSDGHWDWDLTTNQLYNSKRWKELLGYKEEDLDTRPETVFTLIHPDDLPRVEAALAAHFTRQVPYNIEFRIRHKNGEYRWFQSRGEAVWGKDGRPIRMVGVSTDITDRKRAEAALVESNERYRSLVRAAGIIIIVLTPDHKIIEWNREAEQLYGWRREEVLGEDYFELCLPKAARNGVTRDIDTVLAGHETRGYENAITARDGTIRIVSWNVTRIVDAAGRPTAIVAAGHDITERKGAEMQLQDTLMRVRTLSARLEIIQEEERRRIGRELHDQLGVGLTCLKIDLSRARALVDGMEPLQAREQLLERLDAMVKMTDDTIEGIHRIVAELRPTMLDDLGLIAAIEWQVQDFQERTGVPCLLTVPNEEIPLEPNRATAVFRICQEALTNVIRHARATSVRVSLHERDGHVLFEVADNGVGIPAGKLTDPQSLGLLGMRERAEALGGSVVVEGSSGRGTTVTLRMPVGRSGPFITGGR